MLTEIKHTIEGTVFMSTQLKIEDRPDLQVIVQDLLALRSLSKDGIVLTHRSQRELVAKLKPHELAMVARAVKDAEIRTQPIFTQR